MTTLPFMLDPTFWIAVVQSSVTELLFLALGIAVSWKTLTSTAADEVSGVDACMETYQPRVPENAGFEDRQKEGISDGA